MHTPSATYRLQFGPGFEFTSAQRIASYLADLGISTVYASPIFKARPGSTHGYDVAELNEINSELGSAEDFDRLIDSLHEHRMGWVQDFVPNHMAYHSANLLLMDIFEKGHSSPYFEFFDIVWDHLRLNLRGKLIAPFLGRPYAEALEARELKLQYDSSGFSIKYYETIYPVRIESYSDLLGHRLDELKERLGETDRDFTRVLALVQILASMQNDPAASEGRNAQIRLAKDILWELYRSNSIVKDFIDANVSVFNRDVELLDALLSAQWFRFTYWRVASKEINYQRFFNVNDLISLRMEDNKVFDYSHELVLKLLRNRRIDGLRIDHIDGLYDPTGYLKYLRDKAGACYLVVEKVLEQREHLPRAWPVDGTTGYEFMNRVNGLFVDQANRRVFDRIYEEFTGAGIPYEDLVYEKQELMIERHLTGDLDNIAHLLKRISTTTRQGIDLTMDGLKKALVELSAVFPIYRTYMDGGPVSEHDQLYLREALGKARIRNTELGRELDFLESVLMLRIPDTVAPEDRFLWLSFVMRFQQFTSPLMAKGIEDTVFYVYNRLVALNEVGGNPSRFGSSIDEFHEFNAERARRHPLTMNATSTHDCKRGEDVRTRIDVLSEIPDQWETNLSLWFEQNADYRLLVNGQQTPDRNQEYFLYQTLIGAFPSTSLRPVQSPDHQQSGFVDRIKSYMVKSAREAKIHTHWMAPNIDHEIALESFVDGILTPAATNRFLESLRAFARQVAWYGYFNSLSQTLLKMTSPGLPDFYQGTELWDLNLVDPDNRRPVDYAGRAEVLRSIRDRERSALIPLIDELLETIEDGRIKCFVIYRALSARNKHPGAFCAR